MKLMMQIKTTVEEAEKFVNNLSSQGYTAHRVGDHVHFTDNDTGVTSIRYAVTIFDDEAFIGIRP